MSSEDLVVFACGLFLLENKRPCAQKNAFFELLAFWRSKSLLPVTESLSQNRTLIC